MGDSGPAKSIYESPAGRRYRPKQTGTPNDAYTPMDHSFYPAHTTRFFFFFCAHRYHRANAVRYHSGSACPGLCMLNHYCAITRLDYDEFRICLEKEQLALQGRAPAALMPTSWSWLLGVLAVFYGLHAGRWSGGCNNCHIQRI